MSDEEDHPVETPELVDEGGAADGGPVVSGESIEQPAKVMRVGAMMRQLLEQVRDIDLDEPSRERMRDIYEQSITELGSALSPELHDELLRLSLPFSDLEARHRMALTAQNSQDVVLRKRQPVVAQQPRQAILQQVAGPQDCQRRLLFQGSKRAAFFQFSLQS